MGENNLLDDQLPDISQCTENFYQCRFKFDPDYSSIYGFFFMISMIFIVLPYFVSCWNFLFFEKVLFQKTIFQLFCPKKSLFNKWKSSKKKRVNFNQKMRGKKTKFNHHIAYKKVDNLYLVKNVERSKINQVAPINHTETDEGEMSNVMITENNLNKGHVSQRSHMSYVSQKKSGRKKGILGSKVKVKRERKRRKTIFRKNKPDDKEVEESDMKSSRSKRSQFNLRSTSNIDLAQVSKNRKRLFAEQKKQVQSFMNTDEISRSSYGLNTPHQAPRKRRRERKLTSMKGFGAESSYQGSSVKQKRKNKLFNVQEKQMRERRGYRTGTRKATNTPKILPRSKRGVAMKSQKYGFDDGR